MKKHIDYSLFVAIIFLLAFGLVMLYSASYYNSQLKFGSSTWYLFKQLRATLLGIVIMLILSRINYRIWKKFAIVAYVLSIILILLVLSPLGIESNGAKRWIGVGALSFQPSEFAKIAIIIFLAYLIEKNIKDIQKISTLLKMLAFVIPIVVLIAVVTNNLSTAIIIFAIALVMFFVSSRKTVWLFAVGGVGVVAAVLYIMFTNFRSDRIDAWLSPESYSSDVGYQILQALYAIGSGGVFGKGLGNSVQKLGFVPEAQNDMIFTIICEELGLFGAICLILVFVFMIWRFMTTANKAPDLFGSLIATGIMAHISIQVVLNIAVVTNTIPNTGVTLPFISYGGTSILFLLAEMGLVLSVSRYIRRDLN